MKNMKVEAVGQVTLWDVASGTEIGALKGHGKGVTQVAFSRDGRLLASSSSDNTIRIWDVAGAPRVAHPYRAHRQYRVAGLQPRLAAARFGQRRRRRLFCGTPTQANTC